MSLAKPTDFTDQERKILEACHSPAQIQEFIDTLSYNFEADGIARLRSFRGVVRDRMAHCFEGALAAAAIMQYHGKHPILLCMESDVIDHIVCAYEENGYWGAIGQSRDPHIKGRNRSFKTVDDLVASYENLYWDYMIDGSPDLSMRGFATIDPAEANEDWITAKGDLWFMEKKLYEVAYKALHPEEGKAYFQSNENGSITWLR